MRPRGRHYPLGSSSLDQPRRLGSLINTTYASCIHTASLLHASSHNHAYPHLTAYAHEESDLESDSDNEYITSSEEDQEYQEGSDKEEGQSIDVDDDDYSDDYYSGSQEDDEDEDEEDREEHHHPRLYDSNPHLCPHNHYHLHQHHHPHPLHVYHNTHILHLDDSDSDSDLDESEDEGTPLVNYLEIANILTNDQMDTDGSYSEHGDDGIEYSSQVHSDEDPYYQDESDGQGERDGEGDGEIDYDPHEATSSVESQPADDTSIFALTGPLPALAGPNYTHDAMLPHAPMPPDSSDDYPHFLGQHGAEAWFASNPNAQTLKPNNYGLIGFLGQWARQNRMLQGLSRGRSPLPEKVSKLGESELKRIGYDDLKGDGCDFQGIDWEDLGVSRKEARERRLLTYSNYTNCAESDRWKPEDAVLPRSDNFFRFRRMDIRRDTHLAHFQLRNLLACPSRMRFFYPSVHSVVEFNPFDREGKKVIETGEELNAQVSALASDCGVLVSGCFNGEYTIRPVGTGETSCRTGTITSDPYGITNHIQIHMGRLSSGPVAVFASNDKAVRVLDIETEKWLSEDIFTFPVNCTALSPDKRLRAVVGDNKNMLITAAESSLEGNKPEIFYELKGHRDFGFAVDWADDGWTIASAFQDKTIRIWDARFLKDRLGESEPTEIIRTEMAGARNLKFSPIGSGKRCLVAAEEADYVNIIDAQTFRTKQTIDFFGEIGGISFAQQGQELVVLCCDPERGGIMQFERVGLTSADYSIPMDELDWKPSLFTDKKRKENMAGGPRHGAAYVDVEPF
ncbi:WD40-repeat-containing domain protein [Podospora fimiseda]|uniref:WD40-repeat-containing domain protein n=1 Tax=Podospora fimiseda TaxID=252190 RepID=A0AAN7BX53_9PEZI|nr:WD40-repeat-containing domain protein [Podospora fimiseda]